MNNHAREKGLRTYGTLIFGLLFLVSAVCCTKIFYVLSAKKDMPPINTNISREKIRLALLSHQFGISDEYLEPAVRRFDESTVLGLLACDRVDLEKIGEHLVEESCQDKFYTMLQPSTREDRVLPSTDDCVTALEEFIQMVQRPPNETCTMHDAEYICEKRQEYHPKKGKPRIGILVVAIHGDERVKAASLANKRAYAEKHGYGLHVLEETSKLTTRKTPWMKVPFLVSMMQSEYEYIWSLDLDTMILDMDVRLEDMVDPNYNILIGVDPNAVNSGSFIMKKSDWSILFLYAVWLKVNAPKADVWWENAAIVELAENPYISNHIKKMPQTVFNSYERNFKQHRDVLPFVIHFAGDEKKWEKVLQYTDVLSSLPSV